MWCTLQYSNLLYTTLLYCIVHYCTVLYCVLLYCTALHCTVLYNIVLYLCKMTSVWQERNWSKDGRLHLLCQSLCQDEKGRKRRREEIEEEE